MDFYLEDDSSGRPQVNSIDFRAELNDEQFAAVTAPPGPSLVLAGAGSGKTRTLTFRVAYLLSRGARPGEILLLTFTNKAAREMLERVEELTGISGKKFWGGTFHHIAHRILRIHGESIGLKKAFTILDQKDSESFLNEVVKDIDPTFFKDKTHPKARQLGDILSMSRNTCLSLEETVRRHYDHQVRVIDRLPPLFRAYQAKKLKEQVVDYDDLLAYLLELLEKEETIARYFQERFRHILVDEYQDTNTLQARIIDAIGVHHQIMAVGDDAQCIYSWRGANFENIITFPDRHSGTEIHKIETNYRSSPQILAFANSILLNQGSGFEKELRPSRENSDRPYFVATMDAREQAQFIVKRMEGLCSEGRNLSEIAILYRAHFQALELQMELSRLGIPYQITSGVRFFEQAHVRDMVAQLRFAYNPLDSTSFHRIVALLPKIGLKTATRLHILAVDLARKEKITIPEALLLDAILKKVPVAARDEWPSFALSLKDISEACSRALPQEVIQIALDSWYGDFLRGAYANYTSRLEDLKSLVGFSGRFGDMQELLAQLILLNSETTDRAAESEGDFVRLTTVHQAKGLEFPVVFVIGLAEGLFPLRRAVEEGNVDEERRLFYVAVTRARDELYLSFPRFSKSGAPMQLEPSRFLSEIPSDLYESLRIQRKPRW